MRIDITITMGEDSRIMSLEEARGLYGELHKLFGNTSPVGVSGSVKSKPTIPRAAEQKSTGQIISEQRTAPEVPKGNPRVEAAKDRAAARTAGCGSSRNTSNSGCGSR